MQIDSNVLSYKKNESETSYTINLISQTIAFFDTIIPIDSTILSSSISQIPTCRFHL